MLEPLKYICCYLADNYFFKCIQIYIYLLFVLRFILSNNSHNSTIPVFKQNSSKLKVRYKLVLFVSISNALYSLFILLPPYFFIKLLELLCINHRMPSFLEFVFNGQQHSHLVSQIVGHWITQDEILTFTFLMIGVIKLIRQVQFYICYYFRVINPIQSALIVTCTYSQPDQVVQYQKKHVILIFMADVNKSERGQRASINNYNIVRLLAEGSFAQVYEAIRLSDNQTVAIKKVHKGDIDKEDKRTEVFIERYILGLSKLHKGIIGFYGSAQDNDYLYYVMELCPYGDLGTRMQDLYETTHINDTLVRVYIYQLAQIIMFLHSQGIAHLDFKPKNIVIAQNYDLKVIDFATCYFFDKVPAQLADQIKKSFRRSQVVFKPKFVGTAEYVSPEMLMDSHASHEADIWALGCIIYEFYFGYQPFTDICDNTIFNNIINLRFSHQKQAPIPNDVQDLIKQLLVIDPSKRLDAASILKHEFFDPIRYYTPWNDPIPIQMDDLFCKKQMCRLNNDQIQSKQDLSQEIIFGYILVPSAGWFCFPKTAILFAYKIPPQLVIYFCSKNVIIVPINAYLKIRFIDGLYVVQQHSLIFKYKDMEARKIDWISVVQNIQ